MGASGKLLFISSGMLVFISGLVSYFTSAMGITVVGFTTLTTPQLNDLTSIPIIGSLLGGLVNISSFVANFIAFNTYQFPPSLFPSELYFLVALLQIGVVIGVIGVLMP